jgi:hypothetical protein
MATLLKFSSVLLRVTVPESSLHPLQPVRRPPSKPIQACSA